MPDSRAAGAPERRGGVAGPRKSRWTLGFAHASPLYFVAFEQGVYHPEDGMSSVIKKRRKKMNKHKHKKLRRRMRHKKRK